MGYEKQNFVNGRVLKAEQLNHIEDGLVALDSGKAPAGYGLGMSAISVTDLNTALNCGFFAWGSNCANAPFSYGMGIALNRFDGRYTQLLFNPHMSGSGQIVVRHYDGSNWLPDEWMNPPMTLGVEYRTTERWNGKAVYTVAVNFGALPNATTKQIDCPGIVASDVIDISGFAKNGNESNPIMMGFLGNLGAYPYVVRGSSTLMISVRTSADLSMYVGYLIVKYTKD